MTVFKLVQKEADYIETISRVLVLKTAKPGTIEYEEREFLIVLIKDYEYRKVRSTVLE